MKTSLFKKTLLSNLVKASGSLLSKDGRRETHQPFPYRLSYPLVVGQLFRSVIADLPHGTRSEGAFRCSSVLLNAVGKRSS